MKLTIETRARSSLQTCVKSLLTRRAGTAGWRVGFNLHTTYRTLSKDHHRGIRQGEGEGAGGAGPDEDPAHQGRAEGDSYRRLQVGHLA